MACVGVAEGRRVVAGLLTDSEWKDVVALSKMRSVFMPDTNLPAQAKTLRWDGGITRYFSHFPGEAPDGYAGGESPEHMAMKLAIYKRLLLLGIPAELEAGADDWRADILVGQQEFSSSLAIEVQITQQSAQRTYERTEQRERSGASTLWVFGPNGMSGSLGHDLLLKTPAFVADTPEKAADIAESVCSGKATYDGLINYQKTPARPVAFMVNCNCGSRWLYPMGAVLLPNRINGDIPPTFISCVRTISVGRSLLPSRRLKAVEDYFNLCAPVIDEAAERYKLDIGRATNVRHRDAWFAGSRHRIYERTYECPNCLASPPPSGNFPRGLDVLRCPAPIFGEVDARSALEIKPSWRAGSARGCIEEVMTDSQWMSGFIQPMRSYIATRLREAAK